MTENSVRELTVVKQLLRVKCDLLGFLTPNREARMRITVIFFFLFLLSEEHKLLVVETDFEIQGLLVTICVADIDLCFSVVDHFNHESLLLLESASHIEVPVS